MLVLVDEAEVTAEPSNETCRFHGGGGGVGSARKPNYAVHLNLMQTAPRPRSSHKLHVAALSFLCLLDGEGSPRGKTSSPTYSNVYFQVLV